MRLSHCLGERVYSRVFLVTSWALESDTVELKPHSRTSNIMHLAKELNFGSFKAFYAEKKNGSNVDWIYVPMKIILDNSRNNQFGTKYE